MKKILSGLIALCFLGTVSCYALVRNVSVSMDIKGVTDGTTVTSVGALRGTREVPGMRLQLRAAGTNGTIRGRGSLTVPDAITYPLVITSGAVTIGTGTGTATTGTSLTLNGYLKPRVGATVPIVIVTDNSGTMTMTVTNLTTTTDYTGFGKVTMRF